MQFTNPVLKATLLKREKRFLAYANLPDGTEVIAHCPNPGSMKGNAEKGAKIWLEDFGPEHFTRLKKKLRYRWLFVESKAVKVCVDTSLSNALVREALEAGKISELKGYDHIQAEFTEKDSRFDFYLENSKSKERCFVEVKSVSMGEGERGAFPDSVTTRGQKHVAGLTKLAQKKNTRAVLLFLLQRDPGKSVSTAPEIDPEYDRLLREGLKKGLEVLVYTVEIGDNFIKLAKKGKFL